MNFNNLKTLTKIFKYFFKTDKHYTIFSSLWIFFKVIQNILLFFVIKFVVEIAQKSATSLEFFKRIFFIILIFITIEGIIQWLWYKRSSLTDYLRDKICFEIIKKASRIKFSNLESSETLNLLSKSQEAVKEMEWRLLYPTADFFINFFTFIAAIISITFITGKSTLILLPIFIIGLYLNSIFIGKIERLGFSLWEVWTATKRHFRYFFQLIFSFKSSKDFRLYNFKDLINYKVSKFNDESYQASKKIIFSQSKLGIVCVGIFQLQNIFIYIFIIYQFYSSKISVANLLTFISIVGALSTSLTGIISGVIKFGSIINYMKPQEEFMNIPEEKFQEKNLEIKEDFKIEFRNVSFKYPSSKKFALENINYKFYSKDIISIVGHNGAGKTTFAKLLLGLYEPCSGEILINNENINSYNKENYYKIFAPVFQDFFLYPTLLKENISLSEYCEENKLNKIFEKIGLLEFNKKYKNNLELQITKNIHKDGIEPSGGEGQKISIARAMYVDRKFLVLDEPTSALDPLFEKEIFENLHNLIKNKGAIFITHRMSSCIKSDKILVLDKGKIVQEGSHEELLNNNSGIYRKMYLSQSKYF
ncbi:MAG: ABC transporter ATP-binding protein [Fusobacteriaceae bacterium]